MVAFWFHFVTILVRKISILLVPVLGTKLSPKRVPKVGPKWGPLSKHIKVLIPGAISVPIWSPILVPKSGYRKLGKNGDEIDTKKNILKAKTRTLPREANLGRRGFRLVKFFAPNYFLHRSAHTRPLEKQGMATARVGHRGCPTLLQLLLNLLVSDATGIALPCRSH